MFMPIWFIVYANPYVFGVHHSLYRNFIDINQFICDTLIKVACSP